MRISDWSSDVCSSDLAIDLSPAAVDGFVFWTRNLRPFFDSLPTVRKRAPFVVQYTVTGYPHALEASVVPAARAIADIRRVAADYGPRAAAWRYDPPRSEERRVGQPWVSTCRSRRAPYT